MRAYCRRTQTAYRASMSSKCWKTDRSETPARSAICLADGLTPPCFEQHEQRIDDGFAVPFPPQDATVRCRLHDRMVRLFAVIVQLSLRPAEARGSAAHTRRIFADLPDYPFAPNYVEVDGLRIHHLAGQGFLGWQNFSQTVEDFDVGFIVNTGCASDLAAESWPRTTRRSPTIATRRARASSRCSSRPPR